MSETISVAQYRQQFVKTEQLKRTKHNAVKTVVDEIKFDSKKEAKRYQELMFIYKAGKISKPILQYKFDLIGCSYICDFLYLDYEKKDFVIEDVKSEHTRKLPVYRIKKKMMKKLYDIEILET